MNSDQRQHHKKGKLLNSVLNDAWLSSTLTNGHVSSADHSTATPRRPKTAVVKPTTYSSSSFTNFRSSATSFEDSSGMKRWNTTKELRNEDSNHSHRSNSSKSPTDSSESSRLRRSKSAENRLHLQDSSAEKGDSPRPSSAGTWSQKTMSISTVMSSGSGSIPATLMKAAPSKDRKVSRVVRIGDRVVVDMGKTRGKWDRNCLTNTLVVLSHFVWHCRLYSILSCIVQINFRSKTL